MRFILTIVRENWLKILLVFLAIIIIIVFLILGATGANAWYYQNKVYPGVYVGNYNLSGSTEKELKDFIENYNDRLSQEGIDLIFKDLEGVDKKIILGNLKGAGDLAKELAVIDSQSFVVKAMSIGRTQNWWRNLWEPWLVYFKNNQKIQANVVMDDVEYQEAIKEVLSPLEDDSNNANIKVTSLNPLAYTIIPEQTGGFFDYKKITRQIKERISVLSFAPINIKLDYFQPIILADDVEAVGKNLPDVLSFGNLMLNYVDSQTSRRQDWVIKPAEYKDWLQVVKDENGNIIFSLDQEKIFAYLTSIKEDIERNVQDAKFVTDGDRVKEFQSGKPGVSINMEKTIIDLQKAFEERNYRPKEVTKTVTIVTNIVEPNIKISDINNLGISHLIGTGTSTFYDSHTNRIKNIANAVKRLNGVLIKPGEEFSANKYAGPYTLENGFLPEEVIKGNEIKKEVGGGMCQIGTTLFRMAMNSGMPITMRFNHSLVVSYYADPVNHNPGTDATLYEPSLDLRFLNDTGSYLLLETEMDFDKQILTFSLWGIDDGRDGWYEHPRVLKWIPAGEAKITEVDTLAPGVKQCQAAFRGAVAQFTYTRITPTGERIERVFDSYYRPLPQICLVGKTNTCPEGASCGTATSTPTVE